MSLNETQGFDFVENVKCSGRSVLFIGHNIYHVYDISDRFVLLDQGEVVHQLDKKDIESPEADENNERHCKKALGMRMHRERSKLSNFLHENARALGAWVILYY